MVAKGSKDYDEAGGDRIERVQQLILEKQKELEALKAENEELKVQNETHKKAYWDLLESWADLRVKYSVAVDELAELKSKQEKAKECISPEQIHENPAAGTTYDIYEE